MVDDPDAAIGVLMTDVSNDPDPMSEDFAEITLEVDAKTKKPVLLGHHWTHCAGANVLTRTRGKGVPSIEGTENLFLAIRHAFAYRDFRALPALCRTARPPGDMVGALAQASG